MSKPALFDGRGAATALVSWLSSGLAGCFDSSVVCAFGAAGRFAPAFVVVAALLALLVAAVLDAVLDLDAGAFGVAVAVCVDFDCDFFVCAGAGFCVWVCGARERGAIVATRGEGGKVGSDRRYALSAEESTHYDVPTTYHPDR